MIHSTLTISISTRNRLESLTRCVQSLTLIADLLNEIIVVDDASDVPLDRLLRRNLGDNFPIKLRVIREEKNKGYIVARNGIVKAAETEFVLNLDDDALLLEADGIHEALRVMRDDAKVAVVAFAQTDENGKSWPEFMQPAPVHHPCVVPAFIGYAHVLRREPFVSMGGYREAYYYMGEEKEYCLRLLDAGFRVIYLPEAKAAHLADPAGRDHAKYIRYTVRNTCLGSLYNDPFLLMSATLPVRLYAYFKMKQGMKLADPGGFKWILKELFRTLPEVWRERRAVKWSTIFEWRRLRREWPRYPAAETE